MSEIIFLSRRRFGGLFVAGAASLFAAPGLSAVRGPKDQGIGGTGSPVHSHNVDQGLGGTGLAGTIEGFGSLFVNGCEVALPRHANVLFDGQPARIAALKVGHVVRLYAERRSGGLSTCAVEATSEVVGPVDRVGDRSLIVMGQQVRIGGRDEETSLRCGDWVAVHGLRQLDRSIVASRIERVAPGGARLAGLLRRDASGAMKVGGLELRNAPEDLLGRSALFAGRFADGALQVECAVSEMKLLAPLGPRLLIEAYVQRQGDGLDLGSGLRVQASAKAVEELAGFEQRSLVSLDLSPERGFVVESLARHAAPRSSGSGMGSNGAPGPGVSEGVAMGPGGPPGFGGGGSGHGAGPHGGHR
jgi:hypothetical protein